MRAVFSLYSPGGGTTSAPETAARILSQADTDRSADSVYCSSIYCCYRDGSVSEEEFVQFCLENSELSAFLTVGR